MDNASTTKRMIGAVVLVLIASLLLAWLLKGENVSTSYNCFLEGEVVYSGQNKPKELDNGSFVVYDDSILRAIKSDGCVLK